MKGLLSITPIFKLLMLIAIPVLLIQSGTLSAATIWQEDFSSYSNGTTTSAKWTRDVTNCNLGQGDHFEVRNQRFQGRDLDGEAVWTSQVIDISSHSDVSISMTVNEGGWNESNDYARVYYKLDGGAETQFATTRLIQKVH